MTTTPGAVMRAYSMDLRVRVLAAVDAGDPTGEVAEAFSVSPAFVRRLVQRRRQTGEVAPAPPATPACPSSATTWPASAGCSPPPRT